MQEWDKYMETHDYLFCGYVNYYYLECVCVCLCVCVKSMYMYMVKETLPHMWGKPWIYPLNSNDLSRHC